MSDRENELKQGEVSDAAASMPPAIPEMPELPEIDEEDLQLLEKYSRRFTGTFAHSLDSKGRMVIPLAFRDMLGKTFTVTPSFDFKSIAVYPEIAYVRMREGHARACAAAKNKQKYQDYLQWLDAYTFRSQECDGQGRVLLPAKLRQVILGEEKDIDIMGSDTYLRIAARAKSDLQLMDFIANIGDTLSGMNE